MKTPVHIASIASISPLGRTSEEIWKNYRNSNHLILKHTFNKTADFAAFLPKDLKDEIRELQLSETRFKNLDESVLFAILVSREAVARAAWGKAKDLGINIGSSRGATQLFEKFYSSFLETGKAEILASSTTTLGNISSWVAQDLQSSGPEISHSVTCSTGLHAILNGIAWLQSGMAEKFLVGGSEAALTPFTIAQMKAMKIYASQDLDYPCRSLDLHKTRNSMILGEGAGVVCLTNSSAESIARICGIGYATEELKHSVSISAEAECIQKSMKMAIKGLDPEEIDAVVMHAPGTVKGDQAEVNAVKNVFGKRVPAMTSNKWKIGHTFGASGILSLELAILLLQKQEFIAVPFSENSKAPKQLKKILVNAVGFGGNAVSVLVSNP